MRFMVSTVRMCDLVKQQLKMQSARLGVSQIDLLQRYVIEGIQRDNAKAEHVMCIDEVAEILCIDDDFEMPEELKLNPEGTLTGRCNTNEKIEKHLKHDNLEGNCLNKLTSYVNGDDVIDEVEEKRSVWRRPPTT